VVVIAVPPLAVADDTYAVTVYDSSSVKHYDDTRAFPAGGVGRGVIRFQVDATGTPTAFQFDAGDRFHAAPVAIGRLTAAG
jgi:hypothetical protein